MYDQLLRRARPGICSIYAQTFVEPFPFLAGTIAAYMAINPLYKTFLWAITGLIWLRSFDNYVIYGVLSFSVPFLSFYVAN
jgi:hypothetical protein